MNSVQNKTDSTSLAAWGHFDVVKVLIHNGARVVEINQKRATAAAPKVPNDVC